MSQSTSKQQADWQDKPETIKQYVMDPKTGTTCTKTLFEEKAISSKSVKNIPQTSTEDAHSRSLKHESLKYLTMLKNRLDTQGSGDEMKTQIPEKSCRISAGMGSRRPTANSKHKQVSKMIKYAENQQLHHPPENQGLFAFDNFDPNGPPAQEPAQMDGDEGRNPDNQQPERNQHHNN